MRSQTAVWLELKIDVEMCSKMDPPNESVLNASCVPKANDTLMNASNVE